MGQIISMKIIFMDNPIENNFLEIKILYRSLNEFKHFFSDEKNTVDFFLFQYNDYITRQILFHF